MKYYRLENEEKIKYVALPSEFWLPVAEYVCFHPDYKNEDDLFDLIADREDEPEWFLEELPEVQYNTCVELTQEEYQVHTGFIEQADYFFRCSAIRYSNILQEKVSVQCEKRGPRICLVRHLCKNKPLR